jgi:hypothetical protein
MSMSVRYRYWRENWREFASAHFAVSCLLRLLFYVTLLLDRVSLVWMFGADEARWLLQESLFKKDRWGWWETIPWGHFAWSVVAGLMAWPSLLLYCVVTMDALEVISLSRSHASMVFNAAGFALIVWSLLVLIALGTFARRKLAAFSASRNGNAERRGTTQEHE